MILNHQVGPARKGRGVDAAETAIVVVEEDEEEDSVSTRIMETFMKNESGRVIKGKQKRFAIDTAKKKIGYVVVVHQYLADLYRESKRKRERKYIYLRLL